MSGAVSRSPTEGAPVAHGADSPGPEPVPRTALFVCVENAGRSLMAEAIFNANAPEGWVGASAGTRPAVAPNPRTGPMLEEIGLRLPAHAPRILTPQMMASAHVIVSMGCLDDASCPVRLADRITYDWQLPDPAPLDDAGFRRVRDSIRQRVDRLSAEIRTTARVRARTVTLARRRSA